MGELVLSLGLGLVLPGLLAGGVAHWFGPRWALMLTLAVAALAIGVTVAFFAGAITNAGEFHYRLLVGVPLAGLCWLASLGALLGALVGTAFFRRKVG